ncbi:MAG TPA: aspartate kinase [Planctomycetota bacterium]|nr:aspartate kinase [Planctomycetota bacterium]HRV81890.1 aspartate kinase [Planctomycetota bacterium]
MAGFRVLKFGGSALAHGNAISMACELVLTQGGERTVVVVSALQGVTDRLIEAAQAATRDEDLGAELRIRHRTVCRELGLPSDLLDRLWRELQGLLGQIRIRASLTPQALDQVLSFGERASARIVAAVLRQAGVLATPVDAFDLGFETEAATGWSRLAPGVADRIGPALAQIPGIPIVTGFLAKDALGNLTTLGRDGSDWTAAVIAGALRADELIYWKDVPGILSADPRWVSGAQTLARVSFCEARELAFQGAQVLHSAALDDPDKLGIQVRVKSFQRPQVPGTVLTPSEFRTGAVAVACQPELVGVFFEGESAGRMQAKLSSALVRLGSAHLLARFLEQGGSGAAFWFDDGPHTDSLLDELPPAAQIRRDQASVAVVGENLGQNIELYRHCLAALEQGAIELHGTHWGDRAHGLSFLVARDSLADAMQRLHDSVVGLPLASSSES